MTHDEVKGWLQLDGAASAYGGLGNMGIGLLGGGGGGGGGGGSGGQVALDLLTVLGAGAMSMQELSEVCNADRNGGETPPTHTLPPSLPPSLPFP